MGAVGRRIGLGQTNQPVFETCRQDNQDARIPSQRMDKKEEEEEEEVRRLTEERRQRRSRQKLFERMLDEEEKSDREQIVQACEER